MGSAIKSIVQLESTDSDEVYVKTIQKKKKKKKGNFLLKPVEKTVKRLIKTNKQALECYEKRHNKSNKKKKDGWLLELAPNVFACNLKALKSAIKV
jgi:hypothetical protein